MLLSRGSNEVRSPSKTILVLGVLDPSRVLLEEDGSNFLPRGPSNLGRGGSQPARRHWASTRTGLLEKKDDFLVKETYSRTILLWTSLRIQAPKNHPGGRLFANYPAGEGEGLLYPRLVLLCGHQYCSCVQEENQPSLVKYTEGSSNLWRGFLQHVG